MNNEIQLPRFYLRFISKYVTLGLYKTVNDAIIKAIRDLIQREERQLKDLTISKILDEINFIIDECNNCSTRENCPQCLNDRNKIITLRLSEIDEIERYLDEIPSNPYRYRG
ncbi:MAG: hypothetical protein ACTSRS_19000 [Candidatus Helarchaeota archaeon]